MLVITSFLIYYYRPTGVNERHTIEDHEPPFIEGLEWKPVRVINDKVYDGMISFTVKDEDSNISKAIVKFIPKTYSNLSAEAFPSDSESELNLIPVDGLFDDKIEEFKVNVTNIRGGREYEIKVFAEDKLGNQCMLNTYTPYIREFENLGKVLYDKGYVIGVTYFEYYPDPIPWKIVSPRAINPLLGEYNVRDPVVIAKHIDWITGHGINCLFLAWGWDDEEQIAHNTYHESLINLVNSPMINQIHLAIQYETSRLWFHGITNSSGGLWEGFFYLNDTEKWKGVIEDFRVLDKTFFVKENFLRINDKPVVYWYGSADLSGYVGDFLDAIRSTSKNGICIFSDHARPFGYYSSDDPWWSSKEFEDANEFDGWSIWAAGWHFPINEPRNVYFPIALENGYNFWSRMAEKKGKLFMPSILPGCVDLRVSYDELKHMSLPRDVDMFTNELKIALRFALPVEDKKIIKIDKFNDYGEGDVIEPTVEEGFTFLEAVRNTIITCGDTTPPLVSNFSWIPLNIRNDKVTSFRVWFEAEDISIGSDLIGISKAELHVIPVDYEYLPKEAFPVEDIRIISLIPVDGVYDEAKEEFEVIIGDIKGGREYVLKILVEDVEGNTREEEITMPYIREFENIAPLDNITVIVPYYLWYEEDLSNWKSGHKYVPLLGEYVSKDQIVIFKHIDWATGHGIDVFAISWGTHDDNNLQFLLKNPLSEDISISIIYASAKERLKTIEEPLHFGSINVTDPYNIDILLDDFEYLSRSYFNKTQYYKIDSRPVVIIYDTPALIGDLRYAIKRIREYVGNVSGYEVYLVSDLVEHNDPYYMVEDEEYAERVRQFDAITSYLLFGGYSDKGIYAGGSYEEQLRIAYSVWENWCIENDRDLIPLTIPEYDGRYSIWGEPDSVPLKRSPETSRERLDIILNISKIVFYGTWNEFFQSSTLEPSIEYGFESIEILKDVLKSYS